MDTAGVGAWKRGDGFNATPDTTHYVCFACLQAWKQRLDGPLTHDVVGDLAFFSCRRDDCGAPLSIARESPTPTGVELACPHGHRYAVRAGDAGGLVLAERE
jgi:hypothetical protein